MKPIVIECARLVALRVAPAFCIVLGMCFVAGALVRHEVIAAPADIETQERQVPVFVFAPEAVRREPGIPADGVPPRGSTEESVHLARNR